MCVRFHHEDEAKKREQGREGRRTLVACVRDFTFVQCSCVQYLGVPGEGGNEMAQRVHSVTAMADAPPEYLRCVLWERVADREGRWSWRNEVVPCQSVADVGITINIYKTWTGDFRPCSKEGVELWRSCTGWSENDPRH